MDISLVLQLVKARLGLTSSVRDVYLKKIIESVIDELETEKGLSLNGDSPYHLMFVVDYATWRYQSRDASGAMPRHLQLRLHTLMVDQAAQSGGDDA